MRSFCRCRIRSLSRLDAPIRNRSGSQPLRAGDLVDLDQVAHRLLRRADPAGQLDPAAVAGGQREVAHRLQHHQRGRRRRGRRHLAGRGLDHVPAGQQRQPGRAADVVQRGQLAGLQDHLEVRAAAGLPDRDDLLVHLQVAAGRNAPRSMTMSISSAPASTASRTSASLTARLARPDGNAVATLADLHRRAGQLGLRDRRPGPGRCRSRRPAACWGRSGPDAVPCRTAPGPCPGCRRLPAWSGRRSGWRDPARTASTPS